MYHRAYSTTFNDCNASLPIDTPDASTAEGTKQTMKSSKLLHQRSSFVGFVLFISAFVQGISWCHKRCISTVLFDWGWQAHELVQLLTQYLAHSPTRWLSHSLGTSMVHPYGIAYSGLDAYEQTCKNQLISWWTNQPLSSWLELIVACHPIFW